jgi:hypothetical protein
MTTSFRNQRSKTHLTPDHPWSGYAIRGKRLPHLNFNERTSATPLVIRGPALLSVGSTASRKSHWQAFQFNGAFRFKKSDSGDPNPTQFRFMNSNFLEFRM